ncbi:MAG: tetratricopeptide repeat protein [Candidatus Azobacteroides sp.]|nr:tetratricopeptide repeat protein [Candidatus Azobacteroides sp.]
MNSLRKNTILLFFLFVFTSLYSQNKKDSVYAELDQVMKKRSDYVKQKEERIAGLKNLRKEYLSVLQEYSLNEELYKEYQKFQLDSAIHYVKTNLQLAEKMQRKDFVQTSLLQLATLYSSTGMYRESEEILQNINKENLSKEALADYYEAYSLFFSHYAANNLQEEYIQQIRIYRDSLLSLLNPSSLRYKINEAENDIAAGNPEKAEKNLLALLEKTKNTPQDYAMNCYLLGNIYRERGEPGKEIKYYSLSAIADIKSAIKDNASLQALALSYYERGDIDKANEFIQAAIEDAMYCKVQFRTVLISEFNTIINAAYQEKETKRKEQLQLSLLLISVLSFFLLLAIGYVYKQMRKVSGIREELSKTNEKLTELNKDISRKNEQLHEINIQLSESNHIKEEYIAHFFDLCSAYINKLENYRKSLSKKASEKKIDELLKILKSTKVVENELEELYHNFDHIFLNLYPTFVEDFNSLLIKEEQIILKQGELLNTELRIFALIRLGITDSVKIAAFLRYSLSTIYNYRTKTRNKAAVSRDEFEKKVMKIAKI